MKVAAIAVCVAAMGLVVGACTPREMSASQSAHRQHVRHRPGVSRDGIVVGFASRCGPVSVAIMPITVTASRAGRTIASRVVRNRFRPGHYRMVLPPGRYLMSAPPSGHWAQVVVIRPGRTVRADFPALCS